MTRPQYFWPMGRVITKRIPVNDELRNLKSALQVYSEAVEAYRAQEARGRTEIYKLSRMRSSSSRQSVIATLSRVEADRKHVEELFMNTIQPLLKTQLGLNEQIHPFVMSRFKFHIPTGPGDLQLDIADQLVKLVSMISKGMTDDEIDVTGGDIKEVMILFHWPYRWVL